MSKNAADLKSLKPSLFISTASVGALLASSQEADAGVQHLTLNISFDRPAATTGGDIPFFYNNTTVPLLRNGTSLLGFGQIGMRGARYVDSSTFGAFSIYFNLYNAATNFGKIGTQTGGNAFWKQLDAGPAISMLSVPTQQTSDGNNYIAVVSTENPPNVIGFGGNSWRPPLTASGSAYQSGTVNGFIGFYFGTLGSPLYGWAEIDLSFASDGTLIGYDLVQLAFSEINGQALNVGQTSAIPEPSAVGTGLGLLALGAAGLRARRKRKTKEPETSNG